jgi:hypothetical protein
MAASRREVTVEWDDSQVRKWLHDPNGDLGRELMDVLGRHVLEGAQRRALRRTGRMVAAMRYEVGSDAAGVYADVISPVRNPETGFPYAMVHERRKPRDRRPHRSLAPALNDIRHILSG